MKITLGELRRFIFLTEAGEKKKTDPQHVEDEKEEKETDADREEREMLDRIMQAIDMERKTVPAAPSKKMKIGGGGEEEEEIGAHEKKGFSTSRRGFLSGLTAASASALGAGALSALDSPMPAGTTQKKDLSSPLPLEVAVFPVSGENFDDTILAREPFRVTEFGSGTNIESSWIFHPDHWEEVDQLHGEGVISSKAAVIFTSPGAALFPRTPEARELAKRVAAIRTRGKGGKPPDTSDAEDFETESRYRSPRPFDDVRFLRRAFGPGWTDAVDFILDFILDGP